jgi:hypothetical protein
MHIVGEANTLEDVETIKIEYKKKLSEAAENEEDEDDLKNGSHF